MAAPVVRRWAARALLIVAAVAAIPYGLAVSPYWNISPDSATYVGGAQSLATGTGYALLGRPIHLEPPLTSLVYAATWSVSPDGYLGLRVVTVAFLFAGLLVAFFLVRREVGLLTSLVVVVASLGSAFLLQESTRLLSEMFYACFSLAALLVAMATRDEADGRIGAILTNGALGRWPPLAVASTWLATGLFLLGLGISWARGVSPLNVYLVLYVLVCLSWGEVVSRFFVPVMPLVFLYAFVAVRAGADRLGAERGQVAFGVVLALWGVVYARTAWPTMRAEIAEQHASPFGAYPIKYPWNYDAERLALWLRDHSGREMVYASPFPDVYDLISERTSIALPLTRDADAFLAKLDANRVAYVLLSLKEDYVDAYALPAIRQHPKRFVLLTAAPAAELYEVRAR